MKRTLTKEEINACFESATHQAEAVEALYRLAFPDWDAIKSISSWPMIGEEANKYIFSQAIKFDSKHHPSVMAGGLWMQNGFSTTEGKGKVGPWELDSSNCTLEYNDEPAVA